MWAFVPPMPSEVTRAARSGGIGPLGQLVDHLELRLAGVDERIEVLEMERRRIWRRCSVSDGFEQAAMPRRCRDGRWGLTEPIFSGGRGRRKPGRARFNSIGSPMGVARAVRLDGNRPSSAQPRRRERFENDFHLALDAGARKPTLRLPSLLTAVPFDPPRREIVSRSRSSASGEPRHGDSIAYEIQLHENRPVDVDASRDVRRATGTVTIRPGALLSMRPRRERRSQPR